MKRVTDPALLQELDGGTVTSGTVTPGNIDLTNRPRVTNADGSISTVRSFSTNIDGKEVLLPLVGDEGKIITEQESINRYLKSGKHLGVFESPEAATSYAQKLHEQQAETINTPSVAERTKVTDPAILSQLNGEVKEKPPKTFVGKMGANFKQGLSDLGDFVTMDYPGVGEGEYQKVLKQKIKDGVADRLDYQRAFLEGMYNSPGGRFLGAVGGIIPEFNIGTTIVKDYLNPAIVKHTGADESTVALAEMVLTAPLAVKSIGNKSQVPSVQYAPKLVKDTAVATTKGAFKVAGATVKPIVRPVIEAVSGLKNDLQSPAAQEGARLGQKFGVDFSAGELTGNTMAIGMEDALANTIRYGKQFADANKSKTDNILKEFNKTLDTISPEASSRTDVGFRLSNAYNDTRANLVKTRDAQARIDFDAAVKGAGARDTNILSNNFFRTLLELKEEGNARLLTGREELGAQLADKYLKRLSTETKKGNLQAEQISIYEMQKGLSNFSKASKRPGGVIDDANTAALRSVYARLAKALEADLDAEIANPKGDPTRAAMLKVARDNYYEYSQKIADVEKTTLGKIIGHAEHNSAGELIISPEALADKFTRMEATELRNTMNFLDKNHPDVANVARRYMLEQALLKAVEGRGLRGAGTTKDFAKAEFVSKLPDKQRLNALMKDPKAAKDIEDVAAALNRLVDWGADQGGSQTAQRLSMPGKLTDWAKNALFRAIIDDTLAQDLLNPKARMKIAVDARKVNAAQAPTGSVEKQPLKITIRPRKGE